MERLFIFGLSGFAREVNDVGRALGYQTCYIAASEAEREQWRREDPVVLESDISDLSDGVFAIGIGDNAVRRKVAERHGSTLRFVNLLHPSATFGVGQREVIEAQRGVIVCAGVRFTNAISVGDFSIFNLNATIGHDVVIGDYVNVAPGANISGNVRLAANVWVGTNAAINQGQADRLLEIGDGATIGSGSVVVKDCDAGGVYVGIPARKR